MDMVSSTYPPFGYGIQSASYRRLPGPVNRLESLYPYSYPRGPQRTPTFSAGTARHSHPQNDHRSRCVISRKVVARIDVLSNTVFLRSVHSHPFLCRQITCSQAATK
ncbi:hypothetical protein PIB30_094237 [Stylosanthes scabra]|uniref:Uncharacterized protein n=1 Tax=Stylosanthes scabra TaxID=79078 RepID=A0ABU6YT33_9FABA|nr:hypothetical protein [Stylosanthes scabra]